LALQSGQNLLPELLLGATVAMLIFFFLFFMAWFMNDYFVQQKRLEKAIKEKLETDLALIKYQISPHFLFNTLNNLYGMSLIKSDQLPKSLLDLSGILRYILYESSADLISFDKEKEILDAYIQLELLRLHTKENLSFKISADADYKLPPLLWLPIVENIFKHATRHIANEHFVDFNYSIENKIWIINSKNTYGLNTEIKLKEAENGGGIGLQNLKKRLEITYPNKYQWIEKKEGNLYSIFIKIDINE
jgi:LytS/YehU family sensor histidine kinase